jgi:transcriptional regulator with XRE-family HTH domain
MSTQKPITITQSDLSKIVNNLGLRFTVAEIAEKTGIDKGTVSKVLRKKLDPSENFLSSFSKGFGLPPMIYTQSSTTGQVIPFGGQTDENRLLAEKDARISQLETDNRWLKAQLEKLMGTKGK